MLEFLLITSDISSNVISRPEETSICSCNLQRYIKNMCKKYQVRSTCKFTGLGPYTECLAVWTLVYCWRLLSIIYMRFCILLLWINIMNLNNWNNTSRGGWGWEGMNGILTPPFFIYTYIHVFKFRISVREVEIHSLFHFMNTWNGHSGLKMFVQIQCIRYNLIIKSIEFVYIQ